VNILHLLSLPILHAAFTRISTAPDPVAKSHFPMISDQPHFSQHEGFTDLLFRPYHYPHVMRLHSSGS
jgi:hypothetical protein